MPTLDPALLDRLGIASAAICAINCLGLALALAIWPWLWLSRKVLGVDIGWLLLVEVGFALASLALALAAIGWGYRRHRRREPMLLALPGLALLAIGMFSQLHRVAWWGTAIVVLGGLLLVAAHLANLAHARHGAR